MSKMEYPCEKSVHFRHENETLLCPSYSSHWSLSCSQHDENQLFGFKDEDFLRNRCVTDFSSNHAGQVIIHDLLDPSNEAKDDGEFSPNKSSCVFMDDGLPVVLVPWALAGQSVVDICTQALLAVVSH